MNHTRRIFNRLKTGWFVAGLVALVITACSAPPPSPGAPGDGVTPSRAPASTLAAPLAQPTTGAPAAVSFRKDILPIFDQTCLKCHGGDKTEKGLSVKSYEALMQGSQKGTVVVPGDPEASRLAQLLLNGKMPKRGPRLSQSQIELVLEWIRAGAQNN